VEIYLKGWMELDGKRLSWEELQQILLQDPPRVSRFGGEFFISWNGCRARDLFGIIPGDIDPGTVVCNGKLVGSILPEPPGINLEEAIVSAVELRSDQGICAFSGGVDSSLVAKLAGLPCLAIGRAGSHDLAQARKAAGALDLACEFVEITGQDVQEALDAILPVIPYPGPVDTAIAITQYLITRSASELGHKRVLSGQGADELFGGYARYMDSEDLGQELEKDVAGLRHQLFRDQSVAGLNRTFLSLPYMDIRVVRAAQAIPPSDMIQDGVRKRPLRMVAARHLPPEIAYHEKKAMQYGTGVWKLLQGLARTNGYKRSLQGYLDQKIDQKRRDR
jgi:asparagine synthase (glutamine-hydrolysing)